MLRPEGEGIGKVLLASRRKVTGTPGLKHAGSRMAFPARLGARGARGAHCAQRALRALCCAL